MKLRDLYSFFWGVGLVFTSVGPLLGQEGKGRQGLNFENVQVDKQQVVYEQRLYRNPFIGLYGIQKVVNDSAHLLTYVPMIQGIPVARYKMGASLEANALTQAERSAMTKWGFFSLQRRNYKFDFWLQPVFWAKFGNFSKPVRSNTSVLLQSQVYLWPGMALNWGILFPVSNDLDNRPKMIRPAPVFLNQFYAKDNHFVSASAGLFHNDQYGVNVQYRHTDFKSPWSYGLEVGLTGMYYYPRGGLYYEKMDKLLLLADVEYRFSKLDLLLKVSGGQFLWGDKGGRFDFIRQYTNVEIGLFVVATQNGATAGFNFAIPIPPGKIVQTSKMRLRTTEEFRWQYLYAGGYKMGERYQTGYQLDQRLRQYHQNYLNRQYQQTK
ncbi:YjbH domain-containing protein [Runella salmonicolor]|uniref:YjbH domain-containing protein n=1 Tax=Runella salmonicolor TaxID=2950278 RepID=A0ABT1FJU8_9BACT|nr:YjbH domain-containing protein [Runella salmonicolor]MCP1382045.1 YjbH domain-containing protein [Runella salmonicolor]